jgi:hypothetical protein
MFSSFTNNNRPNKILYADLIQYPIASYYYFNKQTISRLLDYIKTGIFSKIHNKKLSHELEKEFTVFNKTNDNNYIKCNYTGVRLNIIKRITIGYLPVNDIDMICLAHNIRYLIATTFEDILHADEIFTNALNIYKHISGDNLFNISQCDNSIII